MASERVARSKRSANAFLAGAVWVLIFVCGTAHAQDYLTQTGSPTFSSPEPRRSSLACK
jgi:hypothetical protein